MSGSSEDSKNALETQEEEEGKVDKKEEAKKKVPYYKLLSFADSWDKILMIIGTTAAVGNGISQPLMTLIFGDMIDVFGTDKATGLGSLVSKISIKFIYLALGVEQHPFCVSCWMITGERQSARIRSLYLKTILGQDIAFFDQEVSTGEVIGRMTDDTILIQDAIGEKVGKFVQVVSSFIGGFAIAFVRGWLLALVLSTSIPLMVISSGVMNFLRYRMALRAQKAYSDAANLVQQTIGSIRTVSY